jgi:hypothetical protein
MLPKAKEMKLDFEALRQRIVERKAGLKRDGIPADAEHAMVAAARGRGGYAGCDSPAARVERTKPFEKDKTRAEAEDPVAPFRALDGPAQSESSTRSSLDFPARILGACSPCSWIFFSIKRTPMRRW